MVERSCVEAVSISSCPALSRASTTLFHLGKKDVDGRAFAAPKRLRPPRRDKPGHDERDYRFALATGSVAVQVISSVQARAASAISGVLSSLPGAAVS